MCHGYGEEGDYHRQEGERRKPLPQHLAAGNRLRIRMAACNWERCCWKRFLLIPKTYCQFSVHTSDAGSCYQHHVARKVGWKKKKTFNFYQDNVSLLFSFLRQDSPAGCNCRWELLARGKHSLQSGDFTWVPLTFWNRQCWGVQGCRLKKVQEHLQPLYAHSSLLGTSLLS